MVVNVQVDLDLQDNKLNNLASLSSDLVFFDTQSSEPSDSEYESGEVALYFKDDEALYRKPHGGTETQIGGGAGGGKTEEQIEDIVGNLIQGGNNVSVDYDDANDSLTISATDSTLTNEEVEDIVGALIVGGNNVDVTYNDSSGEIVVDISGTLTDTRTDVSDSGGVVVTETNDITFTGSNDAAVTVSDDGDNTATVDVDVSDTTLTEEQVDDFVNNLLVGGSDIGLTYDDANDSLSIDFTGSTSSGDTVRAAVPMRSELQDGAAITQAVPVPNGSSIEVRRWGVRTSDNTTPAGLLAQLTQPDGTVVQEENTELTQGSPIVSDTNSSGSVKWYRLSVKNETGTDYIDGNSPDSVFGNFEYQVA